MKPLHLVVPAYTLISCVVVWLETTLYHTISTPMPRSNHNLLPSIDSIHIIVHYYLPKPTTCPSAPHPTFPATAACPSSLPRTLPAAVSSQSALHPISPRTLRPHPLRPFNTPPCETSAQVQIITSDRRFLVPSAPSVTPKYHCLVHYSLSPAKLSSGTGRRITVMLATSKI